MLSFGDEVVYHVTVKKKRVKSEVVFSNVSSWSPRATWVESVRAGVLYRGKCLTKKVVRPNLGENDVAVQCSKCW